MSQSKLTIRILGVCALVLALWGVVASGAQGAASWLVLEGANIVEKGEVTLEKDTTTVLHSKISGVSILLECPSIAFINAKLGAVGTIASGAKIKFSGCIVKLNGAVSAACEPNNGGTEKGVLVTKGLHFALALHILKNEKGEEIGKDELLQVLPDEGETFWTTEMSKLCAIGTKVPVIGRLYFKDCENTFLVHNERHLLEEAPLSELFVISKTEEHKASLLGSWWAKVITNGVFRSFAGHAG